MNKDWVEEGLEEAYRDGLIEVEQPAADFDEAKFSLSEHGIAYGRDLLRDNPQAVAMVATIAVNESDVGDGPEALFDVGKFMAEDAGVNLYRVIQENPELFPWLTDDAISNSMVDGMEEFVDES